jgi:hypothetical protein
MPLNGWRQFVLLSMTITAMLITARLFSNSEAKHERPRKKQISSGSNSACVTNLAVGSEPADAGLVRRDLIPLTSRSSDKTAGETDRVLIIDRWHGGPGHEAEAKYPE